ncbi:hypothetical protein AB0I72_26810, partial [Nocardiopsis sp. NPDC049922]|uniref:hypothetical protein n=1 Tax=Nocardiopsis sp. NPDC049922 TaxID=3155157 RepID=UPI0033EAF617
MGTRNARASECWVRWRWTAVGLAAVLVAVWWVVVGDDACWVWASDADGSGGGGGGAAGAGQSTAQL